MGRVRHRSWVAGQGSNGSRRIVVDALPSLSHRRGRLALALVVGVVPHAVSATNPVPVPLQPGLAQLKKATGIVTGIATLPAIPTVADTTQLAALGLQVQPMHHAPARHRAGPGRRAAPRRHQRRRQRRVPPRADRAPRHRLEQRDGRRAAAGLRSFTGKGVTVAVVDSRLRRHPRRISPTTSPTT